MNGKVKMYNKDKGYGFIRTEEQQDIFFHISALIVDENGDGTITDNDQVTFEIEQNPKGLRAINVKIVK